MTKDILTEAGVIISTRDWTANPPLLHPDYKSTRTRAPTRKLVPMTAALGELSGPVYGHENVRPLDHDLTRNACVNGEPIGERIIIKGRVLDDDAKPVPAALIEIWQANAAGRYIHRTEIHDAPLDPNFLGAGRTVTDDEGRYEFVTLRPGSYPWPNHDNAWRPAHIHFSVFGTAFVSRLVTQMYFEGDPTFVYDPIFNAVPESARERLVARFSMADTRPGFAHAYRFDIVLRGTGATPFSATDG